LLIGKAGLTIGIVEDHPNAAYISSCLGTAGLVNKLLGRNDVDTDPTNDLSAEFERLRQLLPPWTRSSSSTSRRLCRHPF
jgi:hypothetical protein